MCGFVMIKNNVLNLLKKAKKSRYWLYNQMGMSGQNFNKMAFGHTKSIEYKTLEDICEILDCTPGDILVYEKEIDSIKE